MAMSATLLKVHGELLPASHPLSAYYDRLIFSPPDVTVLARATERSLRHHGVRPFDNLPFCYLSNYLSNNQSKTL